MIHEDEVRDGEICPGLTIEQHAESLAMFMLSGRDYSNRELKIWKVMAETDLIFDDDEEFENRLSD